MVWITLFYNTKNKSYIDTDSKKAFSRKKKRTEEGNI